MAYELIDHTGDLGIAVSAATLEALYAEAGRAMLEILADAAGDGPEGLEDFPVDERSPAEGLREFLAELLYRFCAERKIYVSFEPREGIVTAGWRTFDPARHAVRTELKAVTYHGLWAGREGDRWKATVIFDV